MVNTNPTKNVLRKCKQFFSTSVTIRVTLVKDPVVSHETEMDGIVITHVTYPSSYIELSNILLKSTLLYSEFYQII
jgi:phosphatidate phosphatase APP1